MQYPQLIVLADDDSDDRMFFRIALCELYPQCKLEAFPGGAELLAFLRGKPFPFPDLIVLDINMPGINGLEVLSEIKSNPATHNVPVVIHSTSKLQDYIDAALNAGATHYLVKQYEIGCLKTQLQELFLKTNSNNKEISRI